MVWWYIIIVRRCRGANATDPQTHVYICNYPRSRNNFFLFRAREELASEPASKRSTQPTLQVLSHQSNHHHGCHDTYYRHHTTQPWLKRWIEALTPARLTWEAPTRWKSARRVVDASKNSAVLAKRAANSSTTSETIMSRLLWKIRPVFAVGVASLAVRKSRPCVLLVGMLNHVQDSSLTPIILTGTPWSSKKTTRKLRF